MPVTQATHVRWDDVPRERLNDRLERRFVNAKQMTLAQMFLARGCLVPRHAHENEQITHVLKGALRFGLGDDGAEQVDVRAGEILVLPAHLPHQAEALEDSVVADVFCPVRRDWIEGSDAYLRR